MVVNCVPHPTRKSVLTITREDEPWRDVHTAVFGRCPSLPQHCLALDEFEQEFAKLEYRLAKAYAYKRLAAMNMPSAALAKSLRERLVAADVVERVVQELIALGYINDEEWVKSFVRVQTRRKMGPKAIAAKLAAKGLRSEQVEDAAEVALEDVDQRALIQELLATKYRRRDLEDFRERHKVVGALVRRGFDVSEVMEALRGLEE